MARYIDAEKLIEKINSRSTHLLNEWDTFGVLAVIDETPTADVEEVRHGEWIALANGNMKHWKEKCSCCGAMGRGRPPYCRECGAKMDENK